VHGGALTLTARRARAGGVLWAQSPRRGRRALESLDHAERGHAVRPLCPPARARGSERACGSCEQTAELLRTDGRADPRRVMLARGRQVQQLPGQGLRQLPALRRRREPRVRAQEGPRPHPTFPYTSDAHLFPTPSPPSPPLHKRMCVRGRQSQENRVCILLLHQEKEDAQESRRTQGS